MTMPGYAAGRTLPYDVALDRVDSPEIRYIPPGLALMYKDPFTYNVIFNPINAGQTLTATTVINNDSYFVCTQQTATIWDAATQATTNTQPNVAPLLVRIQDSSSGKFKMDQPTPIGALFGTSIAPFEWKRRGSIFMPGGQIAAELTNQTAATNFTVRLQFHGFKVYNVADALAAM
jgi:hypothetical protein